MSRENNLYVQEDYGNVVVIDTGEDRMPSGADMCLCPHCTRRIHHMYTLTPRVARAMAKALLGAAQDAEAHMPKISR